MGQTRLIGLTGSIATGKSVVARILQSIFDAVVIDADAVVHERMRNDADLRAAIVRVFGPDVLRTDGEIDRQRLGDIVFHDPSARRQLERLIHPRVIAITDQRIRTFLEAGAWLVVGMAPLMFETGTHVRFPLVVVTHCSTSTQLHRLMTRDRISDAEARLRIAAQWPSERKARLADVVIHTDGTLEETFGQVVALVHALRPDHPALSRCAERFDRVCRRIIRT